MRVSMRGRVPPRTGRVRAPVGQDVAVHWDSWGVAHVRAGSLGDVCVGLGWAMAQERLWQLDYMRRQARGELAAVLGASALAHDRAMRTVGIGRTAERDATCMPGDVASALEGFAAGINRWIERMRLPPVEFDMLGYRPTPWRPADSIAIWKYRWWRLTGRLDNIALAEAARRLLPPELEAAFMAVELGEESIVPDSGSSAATGSDTGEGSNNWVVGPSRSTTGQAVLCSDPHQPFSLPGEWFEAQMTTPDFDAIGAIYVGTPFVYIGRNRHVAWGVTNHVAPARDVYVEAADAALTTRTETIEVAGGRREQIAVRESARGPIISGAAGPLPDQERTLSLAWVGHRPVTGFDSMLGLQRARNADEVLAALKLWPCPPLNFVYADDGGRFGYHAVGFIPRRQAGGRGFRRAGAAEDEWRGDLDFDEMPQLANPARGWVATANNPPWVSTNRHYVSLAAWADGGRMRQIRKRLTAKSKLSPDEVAAVHADVHSVRARELVPRLVTLLPPSRAVERLRAWDFAFATDSVAASIWAAFWDAWRIEVAAARFPESRVVLAAGQAGAVARRLLLGDDPGWFPEGSVKERAGKAFAQALARLERLAGPRMAGWRWGRLHTIEQRHPLADHPKAPKRMTIGPFPTSGGQTVRAAGYELSANGPFHCTSGSIYRIVVDFSQPGTARATTSVGQSGHPSSPHYRDQTPVWLADGYKPLWMEEADVLANLEGTTTLVP